MPHILLFHVFKHTNHLCMISFSLISTTDLHIQPVQAYLLIGLYFGADLCKISPFSQRHQRDPCTLQDHRYRLQQAYHAMCQVPVYSPYFVEYLYCLPTEGYSDLYIGSGCSHLDRCLLKMRILKFRRRLECVDLQGEGRHWAQGPRTEWQSNRNMVGPMYLIKH